MRVLLPSAARNAQPLLNINVAICSNRASPISVQIVKINGTRFQGLPGACVDNADGMSGERPFFNASFTGPQTDANSCHAPDGLESDWRKGQSVLSIVGRSRMSGDSRTPR